MFLFYVGARWMAAFAEAVAADFQVAPSLASNWWISGRRARVCGH